MQVCPLSSSKGVYVSCCLRVYTWTPLLSSDNWSVSSWWHLCWKKAVLVLNFLFDSPSNLLTCGAVLSFDQLSEAANSVVLTHLLGYPSFCGRSQMSKPFAAQMFSYSLNSSSLLLPGELHWYGFCSSERGMIVALSIPVHSMLESAAAPLRSYHEERKFSGDPHEWITLLQLLSLWIPLPLVFLPHPQAVF